MVRFKILAQSFLSNRQGSVAVLYAFAFCLAMSMCALTIDGASLYGQKRRMQSAVDLAVIAAAHDPSRAFVAASEALIASGVLEPGLNETALRAGTNGVRLVVESGRYKADPSLSPGQRFVPGARPFEAARIVFERPGTPLFSVAFANPPKIGVQGVAAATPQAALSIGSRIASLRGGIANALLNKLLGTSIQLQALDYNRLVGIDIDPILLLGDLAVEVGLTVGTYDDVLDLEVDHGTLLEAVARQLSGAQRSAALAIASVAGHNSKIEIGRLLSVSDLGNRQVGSLTSGLGSSIGLLDMLAASGALSDDNHQISLGLSAALPGLLDLSLDLAVGEPPQGGAWFVIGPEGTVTQTAQIRVQLLARVRAGALGTIQLPLLLEVAPSTARLTAASCQQGGSAQLSVLPGVTRVRLGSVNGTALGDFSRIPHPHPNVQLIRTALLGVTGSATINLSQAQTVTMTFSASDIANRTAKTARTTTPVQAVTASLINTMSLDVQILGLGLGTPALIETTTRTLLLPLAPVLDTVLISVLDTLGLQLGEADVVVAGTYCPPGVLVG